MNSSSAPPPLSRPWRPWEKAVLALIVLIAVGLRILLGLDAPTPIGYVYDFYHEPMISYYQTGALPEADDCWQCYHPPVYTLIGSAIMKLTVLFGSHDLGRALWWIAFFSVPVSLVFLGATYSIIRNFIRHPSVLLPMMALLASLPVVFISSFSIESDLLCATFALCALALYFRYRRDPAWGIPLVAMGVLAGLALGTKYSGLIIVAVLGAMLCWDVLRDRAWRRIAHAAVFAALTLVVGGWHYAENVAEYGTPIVGNEAWDNLEGDRLYLDHYEFLELRGEEFIDLMREDSPKLTLREFPAYNENVPTSLYGQIWTDGSIFSNPWRHGLAKGLYPRKDKPIALVVALLLAGLITLPLAAIGLWVAFRRWPVHMPLLLLAALTLGLYVRWFLSHPIWMLKTKYLFVLVPVALLFCAHGLNCLRRRFPRIQTAATLAVYALALLANAYCFIFAVS
ncbi:MAG TPA: phospholipid carrier-dependent glycosyltransferase [Kiritimatiellia bacterium]|nr:phospholipid carrier-dependent glycosyltransferase [Kiritimatiellia bacterium]